MAMNVELVVDFAGLVVSVLLIVGYHARLHARARRDPGYAVHAVNARARRRWVEVVMQSGRMDVLAVQTLRNSVMASSFMASTAILLIVGVLSWTATPQGSGTLSHATRGIGAGHPVEWVAVLNVVLLVADFFVAFYFYSMAVRYYNHVGYLINIPPAGDAPEFSTGYVALYLNRAGRSYSLGMRTFFFCLPLVFWFFGAWLMIAGTVGLVIALHALDRAPAVRADGPAG